MITEGYMPFAGHQTWYRISGAEHTDKPALVLLHGGPGSTHQYFELLDSLGDERKLVMYDQIGCGNSYLDGHPDMWTPELWTEELKELRKYLGLDHIHLLGQSWGGMLAIRYLIEENPEGICSVILSSTLSSSALWAHEQRRLISFLPGHEQEAIRRAEQTGDYTDPEYLQANEHYMKLHSSDIKDTDPECLRREKRSGKEAYLYGWGPNEYSPSGTLKDFDYTDRLNEIKVPALIISGTNDLCTPLVAKTMYDRIAHSRWELFDGCRHMVFAEETEKYCSLLRHWMSEQENH